MIRVAISFRLTRTISPKGKQSLQYEKKTRQRQKETPKNRNLHAISGPENQRYGSNEETQGKKYTPAHPPPKRPGKNKRRKERRKEKGKAKGKEKEKFLKKTHMLPYELFMGVEYGVPFFRGHAPPDPPGRPLEPTRPAHPWKRCTRTFAIRLHPGGEPATQHAPGRFRKCLKSIHSLVDLPRRNLWMPSMDAPYGLRLWTSPWRTHAHGREQGDLYASITPTLTLNHLRPSSSFVSWSTRTWVASIS